MSKWIPALVLLTALDMAAQGAPAPDQRCDCCAKKPRFDNKVYATFTGPIAIATQTEDFNSSSVSPWQDRVVMIWDLANHMSAPLDQKWDANSVPPTQAYSHPAWTVTNLGEVFGITLDDVGNVYVAASRIYGNNNVGALSNAPAAHKSGQIYILSNGTGAPAPLVWLPQGPSGEGLGNIYYDCSYESLYASNFADGLIYRISGTTIQPKKWDHGANLPTAVDWNGTPLNRPAILGSDGSSSYAALGRRAWAVRVHRNRLYYSIWSQDWSSLNSNVVTHGSLGNEVWSVPLDVNGDPYGPARREIKTPPFSTAISQNNPVSDISFGPMGTMLIAERTMRANNVSYAHASRVLEYSFNGTQWVLANAAAYPIGPGVGTNSAGGVDFDYSAGGRVWATGDAIHLIGNDRIYGLQGFPAGGGSLVNSVLIDLNDNTWYNKGQIGDVVIPCPDCANSIAAPVIKGPETVCVSPAQYTVTPQPGVTYTWAVSGGTPATATGSSVAVTWTSSSGGTVSVTATSTGACGPVTTTLKVKPCTIVCEYCKDFKTTVAMDTPGSVSGGLKSVAPTIASTMPNVRAVTVTLLNTTVAYSGTGCGISGPLFAYIPAASSSSIGALNPPTLPVPNGNQAVWQSSTSVNLAGGVVTPFQLQLPTPPASPPASCDANYSFCLRVSVSDDKCRNCDVIRCFGPFLYWRSAGVPVDDRNNPVVDAIRTVVQDLAGKLTDAWPQEIFLSALLMFIEGDEPLRRPETFAMNSIAFQDGTGALTPSSISELGDLATIMKSHPSVEIRLEGSSLERANAVRDVLQRAGVASRRIVTSVRTDGKRSNSPVDLVLIRK